MIFLQIEGWAAAGKGVLWSLLDGHDKVFVNPIHEFSHVPLFTTSFDEKNFRSMVARSEYYKIEKLSRMGYDLIDFGNNLTLESRFDFNFYKFDKKNYDSVCESKKENVRYLADYAHNFVMNYFSGKYYKKSYEYFASMGNYYEYENYIDSDFWKYTKTIFVRRSIEGILTARTKRVAREIDPENSKQFAPSWNDLMSVGEVESISKYNDLMLKLVEKYPDNIMVIDFDVLVIEPKKQMVRVCEFLGIEYSEILSKSTRDGAIIEKNGYSFVGKILDDPEDYLNKRQRFSIKLHCLLYKLHRQPVNILSINSIVLYIYRKIKQKKLFGAL